MGHALESELGGEPLPIETDAAPGDRARAERRDVDPPPRVRQPAAVAFQHLDVREQVVGEQHRLGGLGVGVGRHHHVRVLLREPDERAFEVQRTGVDLVDRPAQPEAQVGRDLVVPGAARVELARDRPDSTGELELHVHVDVLERAIPGHRACEDVVPDRGQAGDHLVDLGRRQHARLAQRVRVGDGARDVIERELDIDVERLAECERERIGLASEPCAPGLHSR